MVFTPIVLTPNKIEDPRLKAAEVLPETEEEFGEVLRKAEQGDTAAQIVVAHSYRARAEELNEQFRGLLSGSPTMRAPYNLWDRNPLTDAAMELQKKAFEWLCKASEKSADALYELSNCYLYGEGTAKHCRRAQDLLLQAAEAGCLFAQYDVAMQFYYGKDDSVPELSVKQDYGQAVAWLQKAGAQGDCLALYFLGKCCEEGTGTQKDLDKAFAFYQCSAEGSPWGACALARCYESGLGTEKDLKKAIEFYSLAAESGDEEAQSALERLKRR